MVEDRVQDLDSSNCGIFQNIFGIIYLTLTKTVKYKAIHDLTKKQLRHDLTKYLLSTIKTKMNKKCDNMSKT